ncbi:MAG: hypothetical protein R3F46_12325 [bacterium]
MSDLERNERSDGLAGERQQDERGEMLQTGHPSEWRPDGLKPAYTLAKLNSIDLFNLRERKDRIDNPLAREIAEHIWERYWNELRRRILSGAHGHMTNQRIASVLAENRQIDFLCAGRSERVLGYIQNMKQTKLGLIAVEPGVNAKDILQRANPFIKPFINASAPSSSKEMAQFLIDNMELYSTSRPRQPWSITYQIVNITFGISLSAYIASFFEMFTFSRLLSQLILVPVALSLIFYHWAENIQFNRLLALYISFTDEFVGDDQA